MDLFSSSMSSFVQVHLMQKRVLAVISCTCASLRGDDICAFVSENIYIGGSTRFGVGVNGLGTRGLSRMALVVYQYILHQAGVEELSWTCQSGI